MRKVKLTWKQLKEIENKAIRVYDPIVPKTRFWSLEELAKGMPFSRSWIKKTIQKANFARQMNYFSGWKGWTKNKHMRHEARIPQTLFLQPNFQKEYFPEEADEHEKVKALERMKKDYPEYVTYG